MRRSPRVWSALLFVAGLTLGTVTDRVPSREVVRAGGYWVLSGDFHVHVFPGDGGVPPTELPREAQRAGLDVVAVTSHNVTWPGQLARWWAGDNGPIVLAGQEITNPRYHLIGAGLTGTVDWWQPAAAAIADAQRQGGLAIAAHPSRGYWDGLDAGAQRLLDGVEVISGETPATDPRLRQFGEFYDRARAQNMTLARIASTDFHTGPELGLVRTYILAEAPTEAGVLAAIRAGRTVAADADGALHGDPELVRLVASNTPAGRVDVNGGWRRLALASAWVGLLGVVLLRPGSRAPRGRSLAQP